MLFLFLVVSVTCLVSFCGAESNTKYTFPNDACNHWRQPEIPLKDGETVYVSFNGDFGYPECRTMSFKIPQSIFWKYKVCSKLLYYTSPKCQSTVLFVPSSFKNYANDGWSVSDYEKVMNGIECSTPVGIGYYRRLEEEKKSCGQDFTGFDIQLSKGEIAKSWREAFDYRHGYGVKKWKSDSIPIPNHIEDTFSIEITATLEYKVEVIAGICGGLIGLIVLVVIITRMCICMRGRKQLTGRYISKGNYGDSCWKEKGKWWSRDGLDKTDVSPLIVHM